MNHVPSKFSWRPLIKGAPTDQLILLLVSCGGAGLSPIAPGTVGTLAAWALVAALPDVPAWSWLLVAAVSFAAGVWAIDAAQRKTGVHDPGWVVIDEACAYWMIYGIVGGGPLVQAAIFFVFRATDILKPPPARYIDRNWQNGMGVMVDDIVAGLWALPFVAWIASAL